MSTGAEAGDERTGAGLGAIMNERRRLINFARYRAHPSAPTRSGPASTVTRPAVLRRD
ncbi:hypothetical protein J2S46_000275 [Kitasatospora herbaricolor]|uniref:hypothetical protein n=1 Tax=Kitasatospora herbaricolor TaxID=68217 RepID=UPI00174E01CE|nr:hypothetical protein [Kitasatospora herbaricolor]MDQ0305719.1 hypothetical protein [Kitasatospora herbaricolor]